MNHFRKRFLKTFLSLVLVIAMIIGMLPNMTGRATAATKYTVTFNATGGTNPSTGRTTWSVSCDYNSVVKVTTNTFVRPGYTLLGAYVGNTFFSCNTAIRVKSNITINAKWKLSCTHPQTQVRNTNATCTSEGKSEVICSKCKTVLSTARKPKLEHDWKPDQPGNNSGHIMRCNKCNSTKTVSHTWRVWAYRSETQHDVECTECGYLSTQNHTFVLSHFNNGQHYYTCSAEGCSVGKYGSYCRNCIAEGSWRYLVDTTTYSSSGQNFFLRHGTCPECGVQLIEYGNTGFLESSDLWKIISQIIDIALTCVEIVIPDSPGAKKVFSIRTLINIAVEGKSIYSEIKSYMADKKFANKLSGFNVEALKNIQYIKPGTQAYSIAKTYFAPASPANMLTKYDFSTIKSNVRH